MKIHESQPVPIIKSTLSIRSPRAVMLLFPFQLPLLLSLLFLSIVFTIWPEALEHSPISFEDRGFIHHAWHYSLLAGSALALWGLFIADERWRLRMELTGLFVLIGVIGMNFIALLNEVGNSAGQPSGVDMALRVAAILGLLVRAYIIISEPSVKLPSQTKRTRTD